MVFVIVALTGLRQDPSSRKNLIIDLPKRTLLSDEKLTSISKEKSLGSIEADIYLLFTPGAQFYSLILKYYFMFKQLRL